VGTVIIVYNTLNTQVSHPIYAPRVVPNTNPPVYYDMFPRSGGTLWAQDGLSGDFAYNSTSRVNGKEVPPTYTVLNNEVRILSIHNLGGAGLTERISGIGGQSRPSGSRINSVQGSIAAILTFEDNLSSADILELELALQDLYINYTGPALATIPELKYIDGTPVYYDFSAIAIDEWFDIVQYEVIAPLDLGVDFGLANQGILGGTLSRLHEGSITIRITNEVGIFNDFDIPFRSVYKDPLVDALPVPTNISAVFSAALNAGLYADRWEDARRLNSITLNNQENSAYTVNLYPTLNDNYAITTNSTTALSSLSAIAGKTFVWVYVQTSYGIRRLLDVLPDIFGEGALWTIGQTTEVFGSTVPTKLVATVNEHPVDALSYRVPLNQVLIITATSDDIITYNGFSNLRGYMPFIASWDLQLTEGQLDTVRSILALRYIADTSPLIVDNNLRYNYSTSASFDLTGIAADLHTTNPITYTLVNGTTPSSILANVLTYTASTDTLESFTINATNSNNQSTQFVLQIQNILRTNPLYVDIKTYLTGRGKDINQIYIASNDTLSLTTWLEYSLRGDSIALTGTENQSLINYQNLNSVYFTPSGQSYGTLSSPTTATKNIFIVYVSDIPQGNPVNLYTDTPDTLYGGSNGELYGDASANNHYIKVNGAVSNLNYNHNPYTLRVISTKTQQDKALQYLGGLSTSLNGYTSFYMVVDDNLTMSEIDAIHNLIVDTYIYSGYSLKLTFNNTIDDLVYSTASSGTAVYNTSQKKFGAASLELRSSHLFLENNAHYALTNFDFTVQFWLRSTRAVSGADRLNILRLSQLHVYLTSLGLVVASDSVSPAILATSIPIYSSFMHIAIVRQGTMLHLYINGVIRDSNNYFTDISDTLGELQIGQDFPLTQSGSIAVQLDDLSIYNREALYTNNFNVPTAELT
jgi:hypothetical protein